MKGKRESVEERVGRNNKQINLKLSIYQKYGNAVKEEI
jgi:hypothetical protein